MKRKLQVSPLDSDLSSWIKQLYTPFSDRAVELAWVGQAGFVFKTSSAIFAIDLYLSDSLRETCRDHFFPHHRLVEIPCDPHDLKQMHYLFSTHAHDDHLDPGTLSTIYEKPETQTPLLVCPRADMLTAKNLAVPLQKIATLNAGESIHFPSGISIHAIASAHEEMKEDTYGNHHYLGYIIETEGIRLYHSGDCIPYGGLVDTLRAFAIDIALLPVNGRDSFRLKHGILGNFTLNEALSLCEQANIPYLIPHHYHMFDFNTIPVHEIDTITRAATTSTTVIRPELGTVLRLSLLQS